MRSRNSLSLKEVAMIKGMLARGIAQEEILVRFSIPNRPINGGRISEIHTRKKHQDIEVATSKKVDDFLSGKISLGDLMRENTPLFSVEERRELIEDGRVYYIPQKDKISAGESDVLEFKESFHRINIPDYLKILAGMANTGHGGRILFGVNDKAIVLGIKRDINVEKCQKRSSEYFAPYMKLQGSMYMAGSKRIGVLSINHIPALPVICTKSSKCLEEGSIYYRYDSRVIKIKYAELCAIINKSRSKV